LQCLIPKDISNNNSI